MRGSVHSIESEYGDGPDVRWSEEGMGGAVVLLGGGGGATHDQVGVGVDVGTRVRSVMSGSSSRTTCIT